MRLGTWNVEYARGIERNRRRLEEMHRRDADVWVLTETHDDLQLGTPYAAARSAQRPLKQPGARWVTVWSRLPIVETLPVVDPLRMVAVRLLAPPGDIVVVGTVLPWHSDRGDALTDPAPRNWEEHHRKIPRQGAQWARFRADYPRADLCVMGDFNTGINGGYGTRRGRALLAAGGAEPYGLERKDAIPERRRAITAG